MIKKTITLSFLAAFFMLMGFTTMAQKGLYGTMDGSYPFGPTETGPTIYSQMETAGTGFLNSSEYTDAANLTKTAETADDFDVPAGDTWTIGKAAFAGYYGYGNPGGLVNVNVRIYADDNGMPGLEIHSFLNVTPTFADEVLVNDAYYSTYAEVELSPAVVLTEGKYWINIQYIVDFDVNGDWGWADAMNDPWIGEKLHWRCPLDGWGNGYTTWTPGDIVMFFGYFDRAFALYEPSKTDDLAAKSLIGPASAPGLTSMETIEMELKNEGTAVQTGFDVAYIINGGTPVIENVGSFSLNPEETATYAFTTPADLSATDIYSVELVTMLSGDEYMDNDTTVGEVVNYGTVYEMTDGVDITTCEGTFTDPGGLYANFDQNDEATMTIYPGTPGSMVRLTFIAFDVTWSDFTIYDGPNTDSPLLGYWEDDQNPGVVTALNLTGALTIEFIAPGWDDAFGWEAMITCYDKPDDDFGITAFEKSTSLVYTALPMEFSATVRNLGALPQSKDISFYVDGNLIGTANTGTVAPTEYATVTIEHTFLADGVVTAEAVLPDDDGDAPENNSAEMTFDVYLIDTFVEFFEGDDFPPDYWSVSETSVWTLQQSSGFPYNNSKGCAQAWVPWGGFDTLVTPQLYISNGDLISMYLKTSNWWKGELEIIWKNSNTGVWSSIETLYPTTNYENYQVDISAAAGLNYLGFVAECTDPWSWGGELTLDNIVGISPTLFFVDDDLKASNLQGTATPAVNEPETYTVQVQNIGMNTVQYNTYSVKLMQVDPAGDIELTSSIGLTSVHLQERTYNLTHSFQASGEYDVYGVVEYGADMDVSNDTTNYKHIYVQVSGTEEIEVGTQDDERYWIPFWSGTNYSISQTVYPENWINATGAITGLTYYYNNKNYGTVDDIPVKIYIGTTTNTTMTGYITPDNMTMVFDDTIDFDLGTHELYLPFSVPINYTGGNIVAYAYQAHDGWKPTVDFAVDYVDDTLSGWSTSYYYINPEKPDSGTTCNKELMIPVTTFFMNTAGFGEIGGTVYDENNAPLPGVEVTINGTAVSDITDANGEYLINEILGGSQSLTARKFEYEDNSQPINIEAGIVNELDFNMDLKPRVNVTGVVVGNDDPMNYLEGALVQLNGYANFTTATDANGEFAIPAVYGNETYSMNISLNGYAGYFSNNVVVADGNLDVGTIVLDELMSIPYSVFSEETTDSDITVSWLVPNTGIVEDYNYDLIGTNGYANEPYEDVWLGNIYETEDRGTITTVEVYWWWNYTYDGEVQLDILDADGNIVMSSEPFMIEPDSWQMIDIPDVYFEGTFYAMIRWENNPETTHFLGSQDSEFGAHGPNYGFIMYPGEAPYHVSEILEKDVSFEIIVHTTIEEVTDNGSKAIDGYNIYRGLLEDVNNSSSWASLNSGLVTEITYVDESWPPAAAGDYVFAVEAIYTTGESVFSFSNPINYTPVGVDEFSTAEVNVYPNPARNIIYIENSTSGTAVIYSATGQLMGEYRIDDQINSINVSSFNTGLYLIKIVGNNDEVSSFKFFKN